MNTLIIENILIRIDFLANFFYYKYCSQKDTGSDSDSKIKKL